MLTLSFDELKTTIERAFLNAGVGPEKAAVCAAVHAASSRDGVNSHGLNRVPRFCDYVRKGWVQVDAEPELVQARGPEQLQEPERG